VGEKGCGAGRQAMGEREKKERNSFFSPGGTRKLRGNLKVSHIGTLLHKEELVIPGCAVSTPIQITEVLNREGRLGSRVRGPTRAKIVRRE